MKTSLVRSCMFVHAFDCYSHYHNLWFMRYYLPSSLPFNEMKCNLSAQLETADNSSFWCKLISPQSVHFARILSIITPAKCCLKWFTTFTFKLCLLISFKPSFSFIVRPNLPYCFSFVFYFCCSYLLKCQKIKRLTLISLLL